MPRDGVFPVGLLVHCLKQPVWRANVAQPIVLVMNMLKMSTEVGLSGIFQLWVVEGEMESRNVLVSNHALSCLSCPAPGG